MSPCLKMFTTVSSELPYENTFPCSGRADSPRLYLHHYPVAAKGKPKRFYYSTYELQFISLGSEIVASTFYTGFIIFNSITEYLCLKKRKNPKHFCRAGTLYRQAVSHGKTRDGRDKMFLIKSVRKKC